MNSFRLIDVMLEANTTTWPKTADGSTDWEVVFESEEIGLIPLIDKARSPRTLKAAARVVVTMLFSRKDDAKNRDDFEQWLHMIIPENDASLPECGFDIDTKKGEITALLRQVKELRKQKAEEYRLRQKQMADAPPPAPVAPPPPPPAPEVERRAAAPTEAAASLDEVFSNVFCRVLDDRFKALQMGIDEDYWKGRLPFILSKRFSERFNLVLKKYLMPTLRARARGIIVKASGKSPDQWASAIQEELEDRKGRAAMWQIWQETWKKLTSEQPLPQKPQEDKNKGLKGVFKKKNDRPWEKKMTLEEWNETVTRIKAENKVAEETWKAMAKESPVYLAPIEEDKPLLMNLFGRSATGLTGQITALRQIAEQGGDVGRAFDLYQKNKDLDLALLAVCHQYPEMFIGKSAFLRDIVRGYDDSYKQTQLRLVTRYLGEHFTGPSSGDDFPGL